MEMTVSGATRKGRFHDCNEDRFVANERFVIVADGMGGQSSGEVASRIAVDTIEKTLKEGLDGSLTADAVRELVLSAIRKADEEVRGYADSHPESDGLGSTVAAMVRLGRDVCMVWCGDSRCYVYGRGRGLRLLTKDHSLVQGMVDSGEITAEEAMTHPDNNVITRFVGGGEDTCIPESAFYRMDDADVMITCSDGLSGYCTDKEMERRIAVTADRRVLSESLLELALERGSDDDITIVAMAADDRREKSGGGLFGWLRRR